MIEAKSASDFRSSHSIANPHARFAYHGPDEVSLDLPRSSNELPKETKEIKPHPYGIELGTFLKLLKETQAKKLGGFLSEEFSRVSPAVARQVCEQAGVTAHTWVQSVTPQVAEKLYTTLQNTRLKAPSTDCLAPMGAEAILSGILSGIKAEFYTASTRPPARRRPSAPGRRRSRSACYTS